MEKFNIKALGQEVMAAPTNVTNFDFKVLLVIF